MKGKFVNRALSLNMDSFILSAIARLLMRVKVNITSNKTLAAFTLAGVSRPSVSHSSNFIPEMIK